MLEYESLVERITTESDFSADEIEAKVKQKIEQLSGLISKQGAAHIIANELGIKLMSLQQEVKIAKLQLGMKNVDVAGRVVNVYDVRSFKTEAREGKVGSIMLSDETGTARAVLWNEIANYVDKVNLGDVVVIKSAYVRENNRGFKELHLNDRSGIAVNPEGVKIPEVGKKKISDLKEGDFNVEIIGAIIDMFPPNFFELCSECMKRVRLDGEKWQCDTHGEVEPVKSYVFNLLIDDGSSTITATCFKNQADQLFENAINFKDNESLFEQQKSVLIGKMLNLKGRVQMNSFSQTLRFVANNVKLEVPENVADEKQSDSPKENLDKELEELEKIKVDEI